MYAYIYIYIYLHVYIYMHKFCECAPIFICLYLLALCVYLFSSEHALVYVYTKRWSRTSALFSMRIHPTKSIIYLQYLILRFQEMFLLIMNESHKTYEYSTNESCQTYERAMNGSRHTYEWAMTTHMIAHVRVHVPWMSFGRHVWMCHEQGTWACCSELQCCSACCSVLQFFPACCSVL